MTEEEYCTIPLDALITCRCAKAHVKEFGNEHYCITAQNWDYVVSYLHIIGKTYIPFSCDGYAIGDMSGFLSWGTLGVKTLHPWQDVVTAVYQRRHAEVANNA